MAQEKAELERSIEHIWRIAHEWGLDPSPIHFTLVPSHIMYEFGAYGLPGRFSHWTHGKAYHQMKTLYDHGLEKIYELVINTDPAHAFLLEQNSLIQNKLVVAHVLAHVDFFKHNSAFKDTNRQMVESASVNAQRINKYEFEHGKLAVEKVLDSALSIELNIDTVNLSRPTPQEYLVLDKAKFLEDQKTKKKGKTAYDDLFELEVKDKSEEKEFKPPFPYEEEDDLLYFISAFAPDLEEWEREIIQIVRQESLYFLPQRKTRIMNEGWATFWHSRIIRGLEDRNLLQKGEFEEFARMHSAILAPSYRGLNPYLIGLKIFEDIDRKGKGLPSPSGKKEVNWLGEEIKTDYYKNNPFYNIFPARETIGSDLSFFRDHLPYDLIDDQKLFTYHLEGGEWKITSKDPILIKERLLKDLDNFGKPAVRVAVGGGDYKGNREFYLKHIFTGDELDLNWTSRTIKNIYKLWRRSVHVETIIEKNPVVLSSDGTTDIQQKKL